MMISIIIPFRDRARMLRRCVRSIITKTAVGEDYEILLVDNQSRSAFTRHVLWALLREYGTVVRAIAYDRPFNFSAINNFAVRHARGELLLFLNNDTEVIAPRWLSALRATLIADDNIGAVGAKLLYANNTIQHAGIRLRSDCINRYRGERDTADRHAPWNVRCAVDAVTAACMLTRKRDFTALGGFDEEDFAIAYNDMDYCMRLSASGKRIIYEPCAVLYHYESISRGRDIWKRFLHRSRYREFLRERATFLARWGANVQSSS